MFRDKNVIHSKLQENIDWMESKIKRKQNNSLEEARNEILKTFTESEDRNTSNVTLLR